MNRIHIIKTDRNIRTHILIYTFFIGLSLMNGLTIKAQELQATTNPDTTQVAAMIDYLEKAMRFNLYTPQEKVYLHFDNTGYFKGEYIRFKAYVTRCDTEKRTDLSHVLYVELVNPSGDVVERRKLKIVNGEADGDIRVDSIQTTGFYEVRAYTRYMANWGPHACCPRGCLHQPPH